MDPGPVHAPQVVQVTAVGQGMLGEGEERIRVHVRFAQGSDRPTSRIGAAEVNAPRRNERHDLLAEGNRVLFLARHELFKGAQDLPRGGIFNWTDSTRFRAVALARSSGSAQIFDNLADRPPVAVFSRGEEGLVPGQEFFSGSLRR